jgi:hypothetical protein
MALPSFCVGVANKGVLHSFAEENRHKNEATEKNGTSELYKNMVEMEELNPTRRNHLDM